MIYLAQFLSYYRCLLNCESIIMYVMQFEITFDIKSSNKQHKIRSSSTCFNSLRLEPDVEKYCKGCVNLNHVHY